jgi:hypothetical protein
MPWTARSATWRTPRCIWVFAVAAATPAAYPSPAVARLTLSVHPALHPGAAAQTSALASAACLGPAAAPSSSIPAQSHATTAAWLWHHRQCGRACIKSGAGLRVYQQNDCGSIAQTWSCICWPCILHAGLPCWRHLASRHLKMRRMPMHVGLHHVPATLRPSQTLARALKALQRLLC